MLALLACCSALIFPGCRKHVLDGPGMVYVPRWTAFSIRSVSSSPQHDFSFTVHDDDGSSTVTGQCTDAEGSRCEDTAGIVLSAETVQQLRQLELENLQNALSTGAAAPAPDGDSLTLSITLSSGETVEKIVSEALSIQIYEILLPCFTKNN